MFQTYRIQNFELKHLIIKHLFFCQVLSALCVSPYASLKQVYYHRIFHIIIEFLISLNGAYHMLLGHFLL